MSQLLWFVFLVLLFLLSTIILRFLALGNYLSFRRYKLLQKLPGPKGYFLFGSLFELKNAVKNPLLWLMDIIKGYDRLMKIWVFTISTVVLKDPDDVQALFSNIQHADKGLHYITLTSWLGDGLLTSKKDKWHVKRKLLTPAFHFKILENNMSFFNKSSKTLCQKLEQTQGKEVNIESYITLCTLDIIMGTAMAINLNSQLEGGREYVQRLKEAGTLMIERIVKPLLFVDWIYMLSKSGRQLFKLIKYLHDFSNKVIRERKNGFQSNDDSSKNNKTRRAFLDILLQYEFNNPGTFSDKDIREEVDTFMFEGHDTSSVAIIYALYNLATYADIQDKVYQEMTELFGSSDRDVTSNDLNKMTYLEKVIKETLRLYPSVPIVSRNLDHDLVLNDGIIVPAGTGVLAFIYMVHRNEKYWEDPEKFDPERFSEDQTVRRHPYAYIPFSAGPRNCIGQKFAMMEMKTTLATIIRKFKVVPVTEKGDITVFLSLVLRTVDPIKCKFILR